MSFGVDSPWSDQPPGPDNSPPRAVTATAARVRSKARAAQFSVVCSITANAPGIKNRSGNYIAWASTDFICGSQPGYVVTYMESQLTLKRYISGWTNLASDFKRATTSGALLTTYAEYDCNHQNFYTYRNDSYGYVIINGLGYHVPVSNDSSHSCPG